MSRKPQPQSPTFAGRTFLGPEHDHGADHVPADSPRLHANRQSEAEQAHDRIARRLAPPKRSDTHELWRDPSGDVSRHSIALHNTLCKKPGWTFIGPHLVDDDHREPDLDTPVNIGDGEAMSKRTQLEHELAHQARGIDEKPRVIGRHWAEGEGAVPTLDGDPDARPAGPHPWRKS